ncbi:MAG: hypothetical protein H7196_04020 [candidate division SR1 bacterium]|nr:hypothetical protein [candidate division SR1 bacterium]
MLIKKAFVLFVAIIAILTALVLFSQVIPRLVLHNSIRFSNYNNDSFVVYAFGTTEKNYSSSLGSLNTGVSIKSIVAENDIRTKSCFHSNSKVLEARFTVHGWFCIPLYEVVEINCT